MKERVPDRALSELLRHLKRQSSGRQNGDTWAISGMETRELIRALEDLQDARELLEKVSWLRREKRK
jgi:hypothetical protein